MKREQFYCWDFVLKHILTMVENGSTRFLTRFVSDKKSCVNGFHTGWASETSHQPVINAISVISMHTGKVANTIPNDEFNHANDTPILGEKKKVKKKPRISITNPKVKSYSRFFLHPSYEPVGKCWISPIR